MRYAYWTAWSAAWMLTICGIARASTVDALIADLAGKDEIARARARQLLPRESIEAVPKLLTLLRQDDQAVWRAAFNTLMDFTAEVSVPGREADRAEVTRCLMTLLAPGESPVIKQRGLRLLPLVIPEDFDVAPLAALLADADPLMAEKARAALQATGTTRAAEALRAYLPKAAPEFQAAILYALGELRDAPSLEAAAELTRSSDPRVRAAAAKALSWTGDPFRLKAVKAVVAAADDATRSDANDAFIRLVNAIEDRGGNWEVAVACYTEMLGSTASTVKDAGLAGLGRLGDGTCVERVLAVVASSEPPTLQIGVAALGQMQGVDVTKALVAAYPQQPERLRPMLLGALASKQHPLILPVLAEAAQSGNTALRLAALEALRDAALPECLPLLSAATQSKDETERAVANRCLRSFAAVMQERGKPQEAGLAYVAAMNAASDDADRAAILEGLATCPVPEALPLLRQAAANQALIGPTTRALVSTASALTGAKRVPEAVEALDLAQKLDPSPQMRERIAAVLSQAGAVEQLAARLGLIMRWSVVGPFPLGENHAGWDQILVGEPNVSLTAKYMIGKRRVEWQRLKTSTDAGIFDLQRVLGRGDFLLAYAYAEVNVEQATDAVLRIGSDDSVRVWVNGEKVFEQLVSRGIAPDQDNIPIQLKAGKNAILLKVYQDVGGWMFRARLTTPDGQAIKFTQEQ